MVQNLVHSTLKIINYCRSSHDSRYGTAEEGLVQNKMLKATASAIISSFLSRDVAVVTQKYESILLQYDGSIYIRCID